MSEDKSKEKYLGESKLFSTPEKKLVLRLGKEVVNTPNIKNGAVTKEKLNEDVTQYIENWVSNQLQNIQSGAIHFANDLGSSTDRGITQKALTEIITGLRRQLEILGGRIIPIYWGENKIESRDIGAYYYDLDEEILYMMSAIETDDGEGGTYEISDWRPVMTNTNSLYLRIDTMEMYAAYDTDGALFPYNRKEVYRAEMDYVNNFNPDVINNPIYTVIDHADNDRGKTELGTLSVFQSEDGNTVTQLFTTPYIPEEYEGGLYWDEGEPYGEYPKTYYRTLNTNTGDWTGWHELSAHIDVDDALDPTYTSENPVMNRVLTAKFEEVQEILDGETKIRYFDAYDETEGVTYSEANFTNTDGSIVYIVSDNKFALRYGTNYYLNWTVDGTREWDQTEYNDADGKAREDRNFILLTKNNTFSATLDDELSSESDRAVRNSVITKAIEGLKPMIVEFYDPTIQEDGAYTVFTDTTYYEIRESFNSGKRILLKDRTGSECYSVFQVEINNTDNSAIIGFIVKEDGQYRIEISRVPPMQENPDPTPIKIIKVKTGQIEGSSVIIINDKYNSSELIPNGDGSIWQYSLNENFLIKESNPDALDEIVPPSTGVIYVDVNKQLFYRWTGSKYKVIGGDGSGANFESRLGALEKLLGLYYTEENGNRIYNLRNIQDLSSGLANINSVIGSNSTDDETYTDTEGENHLTITARLIGLESNKYNYLTEHQDISGKANAEDVYTKVEANATFQPVGEYLTEHQDLSNYATRNDLDTKADKGHSVVIISFYQTNPPYITNTTNIKAADLHESMPDGIYWLDPSGTGGKFLHKGVYDAESQIIRWGDAEQLSEETLYVTNEQNNQRTFIAKKIKNEHDVVSWEFTDVPFIKNTPTKVAIHVNVEENPEPLKYAYNESGARFTPAEFTTSPEEYADSVVITVDGNEYSEGMKLSAGPHIVTYTLDSGEAYIGTTTSYTIEVEQTAEIVQKFNYIEGNLGYVIVDKVPENITTEDVINAYTITDLYYKHKVIEDGQSVYKVGSTYAEQLHLYTPEEIRADGKMESITYHTDSTHTTTETIILSGGLEPLGPGSNEELVGKCNYIKIMNTLRSSNCIGFKLDQQYPVWLDYAKNSNNVAVTSTGNNTDPSSFKADNVLIVLPRDFIIDGEVNGEAVGGLINVHAAQGSMFYTEHSLCMNKVHISVPSIVSYSVPSVFVNCEYGVDQLQVKDCIFDGYGSYTIGTYCIGLFFRDYDPILNEEWVKDSNNENTNIRIGDLRETNRINHVYVKGCTCHKNLITNFGRLHCVLKSFRIVSNTISNIGGMGITLSTYNSLTYENKMVYVSCPCWIVDNHILGKHEFCKTSSYYYCGIMVENSILYALHNTIKDFMSDFTSSNTIAPTYDCYFNGKQLFYANNIVSNILCPSLADQSTSGIMKAKSLGFYRSYANTSDTDELKAACIKAHFGMIPPIRYWKGNKYLLNPGEITQLWENTGNEEDLSEVMTIFLDTEDTKFNLEGRPLKDFVFSDNIINAIWDGDTNNYESKGEISGNILGAIGTTQWLGVSFEIDNNKFIATKMSSSEWGYDIINKGTSIVGYTNLINARFDGAIDPNYNYRNVWSTGNSELSSSLSICGNTFDVQENEHINIFSSKYYSGRSESWNPDITPISFTNNVVSENSVIQIIAHNMSTYTPGKIRIARYTYPE